MLFEKQTIMIKIIKTVFIAIGFMCLFLFSSCTDKYEERLEGTWEWVDVVNINNDFTEEWHFYDYDLTILRYLNANPDSTWVVESGTYYVEWGIFGKYIHIDETELRSYNTKWDIITLKDDQLIISNDIDGGVLYKEFIKIGN